MIGYNYFYISSLLINCYGAEVLPFEISGKRYIIIVDSILMENFYWKKNIFKIFIIIKVLCIILACLLCPNCMFLIYVVIQFRRKKMLTNPAIFDPCWSLLIHYSLFCIIQNNIWLKYLTVSSKNTVIYIHRFMYI